MKKIIYLICYYFILISLANASGSIYQRGYYKPSTGNYVNSHYKTKKNSTNWDNYSTKYNRNFYTEKKGYRAKDYSTGTYNYGKGKQIYKGNKGGQFYYNNRGKKIYVPKRR